MSRKIVVNGRFLSRRITGVERYGRELLAFIGSRSQIETTCVNGVRGHLWEQFILPTRLASETILWSPANTGPLLVGDQALTIHDLNPLEHPKWFRKSFAVWYRLFLPILARRVKVVFTPSEYVQKKVMKRFAIQHVVVVPNGVNTAEFHPRANQNLYKLPERFLLFVGSLQPGKNLQTLLKAWDDIRHMDSDLWLIIAGDQGKVFASMEFVENQHIRYLGYVPEEVLPGLYAKATLFVLPSLDEGFGLPAIEAMACGTPVIVSDGGALPETVGNAGMIFDASDPYSLSAAIQQCLEDKNLSCSLIENGFECIKAFSWRASAEAIWNTLHEI